ncbi:MAG: type II toxin-antitoxin system YafQ family toxin [Alphaproteobacteria bacterium]
MLKIRATTQFKKDLKKAKTQGQDIAVLGTVIEALQQGQALEAKRRDHSLTGNWRDHRECHVAPDWLLIYRTTEDELRLARVGIYSALFG